MKDSILINNLWETEYENYEVVSLGVKIKISQISKKFKSC